MVSISVVCVGKMKEKFFIDACAEYIKRLGAFGRVSVVELPETRLPDNPSRLQVNSALSDEGRRIIASIEPDSFVTALCVEGKLISSEKLAEIVENTVNFKTGKLTFIIGGSFGLSDEVKGMADFKLSLSPMTFPHHLARVVLFEQLYRAMMINANTKYHK